MLIGHCRLSNESKVLVEIIAINKKKVVVRKLDKHGTFSRGEKIIRHIVKHGVVIHGENVIFRRLLNN